MSFRNTIVFCLLPFSVVVSHTLDWYERLPQPEEIRSARSIEELLPYLDESTTDARLTILAMIRIAEIGGEKAADALCRFYESNDSDDDMEGPVVREAIALRLIGRVGGERAKRTILRVLKNTTNREETRSSTKLLIAANDAAEMIWRDDEAHGVVDSLVHDPPRSLGPVGTANLHATLLVMDMKREGIDSLQNQIDHLLDQVKGPGFGAETIVSPGRYGEHAYITEAVKYLLSFRYGSRVLPRVEHYLDQRGNTLASGTRDAIEQIVGRLHLIAEAEKRETARLERTYEALSQPGARLIVVEENGLKRQKLVVANPDTLEEDASEGP
jgi:hypothetical protein